MYQEDNTRFKRNLKCRAFPYLPGGEGLRGEDRLQVLRGDAAAPKLGEPGEVTVRPLLEPVEVVPPESEKISTS